MVKVYKAGMPMSYQYDKTGKYTLKIVGNIKKAAFSGAGNNGLTSMLTHVNQLDSHIVELLDDAFLNCRQLQYINLAESSLQKIGNNVFKNCVKLTDIEYNSDIQYIGDSCFSSCAALSVLSPYSYEHDASLDVSIVEPKLMHLGNLAFEKSANLNYFVVPPKIDSQSLDDFAFENAAFRHIVFLGDAEVDNDFSKKIIDTEMFGLKTDCMFEVNNDDNVYKYSDKTISVEKINIKYFNLKIEDLPNRMSDLQPQHIYTYSQAYIQHCMDENKNFIVVYIDSKTSTKSKMFLTTDGIMQLFTSAASPNAIVFVLDRNNESVNFDVQHYRNTLMNKIATKQQLIHTTTDTSRILDFPELSFVAYGGVKFQKLCLNCKNFNTMQTQILAAAANVFSEI